MHKIGIIGFGGIPIRLSALRTDWERMFFLWRGTPPKFKRRKKR